MVQFFVPENEAEIKRRRLMAEQLRAQSQIPRETQIVSGVAVPISPLQGLAGALGQGLAGYQEGKIAEVEKADTEQRQKFLKDALTQAGGDPAMMAQKFMENPSTADMGMQLYVENLRAQQKQALTPYQEESLMLRRDMLQQKDDEIKAKEEEKLAEKNNKLTLGKQNFEDSLASMAANYDKLKTGGGISSIQDSGLSNAVTSLQTSAIGQGLGKVLGTENQSLRNQIAADIPLLTNAIKEATGMSAQQMNSNVELQTFLKALSNPENDYEANTAILANLSKKFGTGEVAKFYGQADPLAAARDAIDRGAPREAVIQRLQQSGINAEGL
jgi:hypothetical protein